MRVFVPFLLCLFVSTASAHELPLWEAGIGLTGLTLPAYRGANDQQSYLFPFPYLVYRGEVLRMDRKGLYGRLVDSDRIQFNISADGGVPVSSSGNTVRSGMQDLDPTLQIGPSLEICIFGKCSDAAVIQIRIPIRAVFSSNFSYLSSIGFITNPNINIDWSNLGSDRNWNAGISFGPFFASQQYHRYYYDVSSEYAISSARPTYASHGGYSGSTIVGSFSGKMKNIWLGMFLRYDDLSNAAFIDSPLVQKKYALLAGFGIAYIIDQSADKVSSRD